MSAELDQQQIDEIVSRAVKAVSDELVLPLLLGLTTITAVVTQEPAVGQAVAESLRRLAETCPPNGRLLLLALAHSADPETGKEAPSPSDQLRATLRLIQGGRGDGDAPPTPDAN